MSTNNQSLPMTITRFNLHFDSPTFDACLTFYRDTLGLPVKSTFENAHRRGVIFAVTPTTELEFFDIMDAEAPKHYPAPGTMRIKFMVDDVDAYYAQMQARGVTITAPLADKPWGERAFSIEAPDGLVLHFSMEI